MKRQHLKCIVNAKSMLNLNYDFFDFFPVKCVLRILKIYPFQNPEFQTNKIIPHHLKPTYFQPYLSIVKSYNYFCIATSLYVFAFLLCSKSPLSASEIKAPVDKIAQASKQKFSDAVKVEKAFFNVQGKMKTLQIPSTLF